MAIIVGGPHHGREVPWNGWVVSVHETPGNNIRAFSPPQDDYWYVSYTHRVNGRRVNFYVFEHKHSHRYYSERTRRRDKVLQFLASKKSVLLS